MNQDINTTIQMATMIVAGVDVSGDPNVGNYKFLGLVMMTQDNVDAMHREMIKRKIHKKDIRSKRCRNGILDCVNFKSDENITLCIRIDRDPTINRIHQMRKSKNTQKKKILKMYHYVLFRFLKEKIEDFAIGHGVPITDVYFECDQDCLNMIRDAGLKHGEEGDAHMLADAIAWANNKGMEPQGVISEDLSERLEQDVGNILH